MGKQLWKDDSTDTVAYVKAKPGFGVDVTEKTYGGQLGGAIGVRSTHKEYGDWETKGDVGLKAQVGSEGIECGYTATYKLHAPKAKIGGAEVNAHMGIDASSDMTVHDGL